MDCRIVLGVGERGVVFSCLVQVCLPRGHYYASVGTGTKLTCAFECECVCFSLVYILFLCVFSRNTSVVTTLLRPPVPFSPKILVDQHKKRDFHVKSALVVWNTVRIHLYLFAVPDNPSSP